MLTMLIGIDSNCYAYDAACVVLILFSTAGECFYGSGVSNKSSMSFVII
jgi:hypothetical protein